MGIVRDIESRVDTGRHITIGMLVGVLAILCVAAAVEKQWELVHPQRSQ